MSMERTSNKRVAWIAVFVWMGLIFYLSHQPATTSGQLSAGITRFILQTINIILPNQFEPTTFHFYIRKGAHFFAYFMLGMLVIHALRNRYTFLAMVICVTYAISDEVHQLYIPGRSGEVRDVLIDSIGSIIGITTYLLIERIWRR